MNNFSRLWGVVTVLICLGRDLGVMTGELFLDCKSPWKTHAPSLFCFSYFSGAGLHMKDETDVPGFPYRCNSVVEWLPSLHETPHSIPSTAKRKKKKNPESWMGVLRYGVRDRCPETSGIFPHNSDNCTGWLGCQSRSYTICVHFLILWWNPVGCQTFMPIF
jgi:hypothetical protein